MSTIDLHGYQKSAALQALAEAIERCSAITLVVITGTGQHSQEGGAVLRPAVQKFLDQRGFRYKYEKTGIFHVTTSSGTLRTFQQATQPSTKIIVEGESSQRPKTLRGKKLKVKPITTSASRKPEGLPNWPPVDAPSKKRNRKLNKSTSLLEEIQQENKKLEEGKQASLAEFQTMQERSVQEQDALDRALELSTREDVDEDFLKVLELSLAETKREPDLDAAEEEETLRKIMELSITDSRKEPAAASAEDELLRAIKLSLAEGESKLMDGYDDYEESLRQALEQSAKEIPEHVEDDVLIRSLGFGSRDASDDIAGEETSVTDMDSEDGVYQIR